MKPIDRREALRRVAAVLGCAITAPTLEAVLTGWPAEARAADLAGASTALSPRQDALIATIAEIIIPETDTPGARAAGVDAFIRAMLTSYYPAEERDAFLDGLRAVDERARRSHGQAFLDCNDEQQVELVAALDREAFGETATETTAAVPAESAVAVGGPADAEASGPTEPATRRPTPPLDSWFRRMKELTLIGYYTSEVGAEQELRPTPWGEYRGDIPFSDVGRAWSY